MREKEENIFLAYGVRGIVGKTIFPDTLKKIAWAFGKISRGTIFLSHDVRNSSKEFYQSAYSGLIFSGREVLAAGLTTTPMAIFGINYHKTDGGLIITASHNPPEWNGIKFFAKEAEPIGLDNGLGQVRELIESAPEIPDYQVPESIPILEEYENFLASSFEKDLEESRRPLKIVIDSGNGATSFVLEKLLGHFPWINATTLFWEPDGSFPGRGPNPFLEGALDPLRKKVLETKSEFGVAFDADGDRIFFVDEKGEVVLSDWILAWVSDEILSKNPEEKIVIPIGAPRIVEDIIKDHGQKPIYSKVGFVSMRRELKTHDAIFGGERSGHYYFRDFFCADSGIWAMLTVLKLYLSKNAPLSKILGKYKKYFTTGEINFEIRDRMKAIEILKKQYILGAKFISELDGFFADLGDWWILVRPSNTEPLLRIVIESASDKILNEKKKEVIEIIKKLS